MDYKAISLLNDSISSRRQRDRISQQDIGKAAAQSRVKLDQYRFRLLAGLPYDSDHIERRYHDLLDQIEDVQYQQREIAQDKQVVGQPVSEQPVKEKRHERYNEETQQQDLHCDAPVEYQP